MSVQLTCIYRQSITLSQARNDYLYDHQSIVIDRSIWSIVLVTRQSSVSTMYETAILLTLVKSSLDRNIWSIVFYVTFQFIVLRISRLVRSHVNERVRNKSIHKRKKRWTSHVKKSKFAFRNCRLAHFIIYLEISSRTEEQSISHVRWEFEFIWFAVTSNQVVVFAYLRHMQSQIRSHSFEISYKFALRHISMRRSHLFAKRSNSRSSDSHMLAKVFRVNSRFWIMFFDSRRSLIQLQSADAVKSISSFICLAVDSHRSSLESGAVKYPWESLLWKSTDLKKS